MADLKKIVHTVKFDGNGAGKPQVQLVPGGKEHALRNNPFDRPGFVFRGWNTRADGKGKRLDNRAMVAGDSDVQLFAQWQREFFGKPYQAKKILTMEPAQKPELFVSAQGFCMANLHGKACAACCFIRNTKKYAAGDESDYASSVVLYEVKSGRRIAAANNLPIDHANAMIYDPDKARFYICSLGSATKPGYIFELDEKMKVTGKILPKGGGHIGALALVKDGYLGLRPVGHGKYVLVNMDRNWKVLSQTDILQGYEADYISQGIAADDRYVYNIAADFEDDHWDRHQRMHIYTRDGKLAGMQTIPVPYEVEDAEFFGGKMYVNTNRQKSCEIYRIML